MQKYKRMLGWCLSLIIFLVGPFLLAQDSLVFIIRVDDILNRNNTILPRSIKPFEKVVNQRNAKVTWGVIPHRLIETANQDGNLKQELIETRAQGHEVSMHGYNHICPHCGSYHEFYCPEDPLSYAEQDSLIALGLQVLQDELGMTPTSFIPPSHAADSTTYQVLLDRGIDIISVTSPSRIYLYDGLYNVGINSEYTWNLEPEDYQAQLQKALTDIRATGMNNHYFGILLHDHFIRTGFQDSLVLRWTGELLDSLTMEFGDRIKFMTVSEAAAYFQDDGVAVHMGFVEGPSQFQLSQNQPNPFNPQTRIEYQIPQALPVTLTVHDLSGREVVRLVDRRVSPGRHSVLWQAGQLSSGVYIYRLRAGPHIASKKALLIK